MPPPALCDRLGCDLPEYSSDKKCCGHRTDCGSSPGGWRGIAEIGQSNGGKARCGNTLNAPCNGKCTERGGDGAAQGCNGEQGHADEKAGAAAVMVGDGAPDEET